VTTGNAAQAETGNDIGVPDDPAMRTGRYPHVAAMGSVELVE